MPTEDSSKSSFFFYSLIPMMKNESGHQFHYHRSVQEAVEGLGGEFFAFANQKCTLSLQEPWKKWFRRKKEPRFVIRYLYRLFHDFRALFSLPKGSGERRILFLESFTTGDLLPLVLASLVAAQKGDTVWILFRYKRGKKEMAFQSFLMRWAKKRLKGGWEVLCDNLPLKGHLEKHFGLPLHYLPHYPASITCSPLPREKKWICSWLGGPREEKGLQQVRRLLTLSDPCVEKFILGVPQTVLVHPRVSALEVRLIGGDISRKSYEKEFCESDVFLLPYDSATYKYRTSGIFIEAVLARKIPLVSKETWAAEELERYALHELIADWENPLFFTHLVSLLESAPLKEKLERLHVAYRELHSLPSFRGGLRQLLPQGSLGS